METQNEQSNTEPGQEPKQSKPKVMFLEYTEWKQGQHAISAIIKGPGEKRGRVGARIYIEFTGEPKRAIYTARDAEGKNLFAPTEKLWELKKEIKHHAQTLYTQIHPELRAQAKVAQMSKQPIVQKQPQGIERQIINGAKKIESAVQKAVPETGREEEIKNIRQRKVEKDKGMELER